MTCRKSLEMLGKEGEAEGATNTQRPLEHKQPDKEAVRMSRCGYNGDSAPKYNPEQSVNGGAL